MESMIEKQKPERRCEPRTLADKFCSVEFSANGLATIYQFKLRDLSSKGACVLVKDDSELIKYLKRGDRYKMRYYPTEASGPKAELNTEIRYITKDENGRYPGHYLVGLSILD